MQKKLKIIKPIAAIILAFITVNLLCFGYYRFPGWLDRSDNATAAIWNPNRRILQMTEGMGVHYVDDNGYVNPKKPLAKNGYILALGSSFTQGKEVLENQRFTYLLNEKIKTDDALYVYNMGFDGNFFLSAVEGFDAATKEFPNSKAVIIETADTNYDASALLDAAENQRDYNKLTTGKIFQDNVTKKEKIINFIKESLPYVTFVKEKQLSKFSLDFDGAFGFFKEKEKEEENVEFNEKEYTDALNFLMKKLRSDYSGQIIIMYHSNVKLLPTGEMICLQDKNTFEIFKKCAKENNIDFVSLDDAFLEEYAVTKKVPYGFNNTTMASGHFNKTGHKIAAQELEKILKVENK